VERPGTDPFFSYTRNADYDSVAKTAGIEVPVRTPDGGSSYIVCDLFRPAQGAVAVAGKFPGIVIDYQAYHLVNVLSEAAGAYDFFITRGYNVMVCDPPGTGNSPGILDQFGPAESLANYDLIEWFAGQPYSDGNIGQQGASYAGHTTNMVAGYHPPHLKAIVPDSSFADWYEQTIYHGGIRNLSIFYQPVVVGLTGLGGVNPIGGLVGNTTQTLLTYTLHPLYDDFWRNHSVMPRWDKYTVPALIVDGWDDRYKDGTTKNYMARRENVWLLMGPWAHAAYAGSTAVGTVAATSHQLAWYDYWLKHLPGAELPRAKPLPA
jgi:predicted acyl esterase